MTRASSSWERSPSACTARWTRYEPAPATHTWPDPALGAASSARPQRPVRPVGGELALCPRRGTYRAPGRREDREEPVAGGVHNPPAVVHDRRPEDLVVAVPYGAVADPEPLQQPGGPLHVGEQERHHAGRELVHVRHHLMGGPPRPQAIGSALRGARCHPARGRSRTGESPGADDVRTGTPHGSRRGADVHLGRPAP